jgi:hypothetical protein
MKKLTLCVMTFCLLLLVIPLQLKAAATGSNPVVPDSIEVIKTAEATTLLARLDEISSIDKSNLRPPERKELRKEVRSIKRQLKANSGGVYISVGTLLLVIILLILLL